MSRAFRCDRCGIYLGGWPEIYVKISFANDLSKETQTGFHLERQWEICPSCRDKFIIFIHEREATVREKI